MLSSEIRGEKTEVFTLTRRLCPVFVGLCLLVCSPAVFSQAPTVIEPCPATPAPKATGAKVPQKVGSKTSQTVIDSGIADDPAVTETLSPYREKVAELSVVIGRLDSDLKKASVGAGTIGNLVTDAMLKEARQRSGGNVVLAITNNGGLRKNEIAAGELRMSDIFELMPFENSLVLLHMTGAQVLKILQNGVRDPQAGARVQFRWNAQNRTEVISVKLVDSLGHEHEIVPNEVYSVVTIDYLYNLKSGAYALFQEAKEVKPLGITLRDALLDYVKSETAAGRSIKPKTDDRFVQIGPGPANPEVRF